MRWLPLALLLAVAFHQNVRARTSDLSPWVGGGFGMFSTTDAGSTRHLHVFVQRPGLEREVELPSGLSDGARRMMAWPSAPRVEAFAGEVAAHLGADRQDGEYVLVQVFRRRYASGSLAPSGELIREGRAQILD